MAEIDCIDVDRIVTESTVLLTAKMLLMTLGCIFMAHQNDYASL